MKPDHVSAGWTKEAFEPGSADSHSIRILPHNPDCAAGFSLVEVMVAVLILGVALAGLTEGITTALSSNKESELQTTAALIAAGQIEELRADGILTEGVTEGEGGEGLSLYRWKQTITRAPIDGLYEVSVEVQHTKYARPVYELRTLLFEPPGDSSTEKERKSSFRSKGRRGSQ